MQVSIPHLMIPIKLTIPMAKSNHGHYKSANLSYPNAGAKQRITSYIPNTNVIHGAERVSKTKGANTNFPPIRDGSLEQKGERHTVKEQPNMEVKHNSQGNEQKHKRVVVGLRTHVRPAELNLKKKSLLRPRSLGQSGNPGNNSSATVGNSRTIVKDEKNDWTKRTAVPLFSGEKPARGFQSSVDSRLKHSACVNMLPRESWNTNYKDSSASNKKPPRKPNIRLTLMDITAFLPKQQSRMSAVGSWAETNKEGCLAGQTLQYFTDHTRFQKEVSLEDPRLLPSRPSFIEIRQARGQIARANSQRTHAWATRDLSSVKDLSQIANYCDNDKTDMIMRWLDTGDEKANKRNSLFSLEEVNSQPCTSIEDAVP